MGGRKNKAVFLDRDGVINNDTGHYYIYKVCDVVINDGVVDFLFKVQSAGFMLIIISNQGGIAKGIYTKADVDKVNSYIIDYMHSKGVEITDSYYCPHHSDIGNCLCRKPDSLLLEKAMARYDIDPDKSFFIGDGERDIEAGVKAGLKSIKIERNENLMNYYNNLFEIIKS